MVISRRRSEGDSLDEARAALRDLKTAADWNDATPADRLTPVIHVHAHHPPPPAVGEPAAVAPPRSVLPRTALELAGATMKRFSPSGLLIAFVVALLVYAYLALHGKAPPLPAR